MAEKKGFDLAGLMKSVSKMSTREQIEYLPFDLLDADPNNFYSLDDIEELADSIATVGLVHPLRVRQCGERYTITSGHRRRAAIQLLIDSGEDWSQGVPCVVDRGESEPELAELKLIFANRQRQKTSAELSLEAERTDELFCRLREKGYEFPGRMQEHVAAALGVKASKLKRLHAIRANLIPQLLALYDHNEINEAQAYALQQMPQEVQSFLARQKNVADRATAYQLEQARKNLDGYLHPSCRCPDGSACEHTLMRVKQTAMASASWATCPGGCCLKCSRTQSDCAYRCARARKKLEEEKAQAKADKAAEEERRRQTMAEQKATKAGKYAAIVALAKERGLKPTDPLPLDGCLTLADAERVVETQGQSLSDYTVRVDGLFYEYAYASTVAKVADALDCSVDFLLERTPEPAVNRGGDGEDRRALREAPLREAADGENAGQYPALRGAAAWQTGTPEADGWYAVKLVFLGKALAAPRCFRWDGSAWMQSDGKADRPIDRAVTVAAWFKLPEEEIC